VSDGVLCWRCCLFYWWMVICCSFCISNLKLKAGVSRFSSQLRYRSFLLPKRIIIELTSLISFPEQS
jgi:hypothetical protein